MMSKECRNTRREIDELELGARPSADASSHLAICAACREFRAERTQLRELVGSLEPVTAPGDFEMRLRARIAADRSASRQQPFFARLLSTPALAAAALFVVVTGSIVWVSQRQTSSPVDKSTAVAGGNNGSTAVKPQNDETTTPRAIENPPSAGPEVIADKGKNPPISRPRSSRSSRAQDFAVLPATPIRQDDRAYVPSRRVQFDLQDERGNTRRISLPPVSFGAQSLVDNRNVNYSPNSRVW
jgi:hypothetical protein